MRRNPKLHCKSLQKTSQVLAITSCPSALHFGHQDEKCNFVHSPTPKRYVLNKWPCLHQATIRTCTRWNVNQTDPTTGDNVTPNVNHAGVSTLRLVKKLRERGVGGVRGYPSVVATRSATRRARTISSPYVPVTGNRTPISVCSSTRNARTKESSSKLKVTICLENMLSTRGVQKPPLFEERVKNFPSF